MNKLLAILLLSVSSISFGADVTSGYDDYGTYVEWESDITVDEEYQMYDSEYGYRDVEVTDIDHSGHTVEVEIYDYDSGEYRYIEME